MLRIEIKIEGITKVIVATHWTQMSEAGVWVAGVVDNYGQKNQSTHDESFPIATIEHCTVTGA